MTDGNGRIVVGKAGWAVAIGILLAVAGYSAYRFHRYQRCSDLEHSFLASVEGVRNAAVTEPLARQYGSDGKAHQLALKMNAKGMEYFIGQIGEECGFDASNDALRKARQIVR